MAATRVYPEAIAIRQHVVTKQAVEKVNEFNTKNCLFPNIVSLILISTIQLDCMLMSLMIKHK